MQKAQNLVAVRYSSKWSDLGGWDAVWSESDKDAFGNAISDGANVIDCKESLLRSETDGQEIVGLGLEDIIAIAMPDAVLVAHKSRAQDVKVAVDLLRENKIPQAESFPKDHRPWGWFESLMLSDCFQVKRICVNPGAALSLQSHQFRSEHWIVVSGSVKVTVDEVRTTIPEGGSIFVPQSAVHRMENETETPAIVIEVQVGSYFGEDDIIRHGDKYNRD